MANGTESKGGREDQTVRTRLVVDEIKERLLQGASRQELVDEGYNANSVRTIESIIKMEARKADEQR